MREPAAKRVTLATIARAAGVSVPTVSRVLNGDDQVAETTRRRIEGLLSRYDYRPRNSRPPVPAGMFHVIYPRIDTSWQTEHLRGMEAVMREAGAGLMVSALDHGSPDTRADGVILAAASGESSLGEALGRSAVPLVALDPGAKAAARLPTIGAANWLGARAATEHLLALGHRRIGMISGSNGGLLCSRARVDGYRAALEDAGMPSDPALIRHGEFEFRSGVTAARDLLDHAEPPTAIFACSDHIALGVYETARLRGLSIPDDLSVVGFDDLPAARWASPPLTTVRQPLAEMGELAARTILTLARRRPLASPRMELGTRLIVRGSTGSPR